MESAVSVTDLSVSYRGGLRSPAVEALRNLSLRVAPGEIVGVLGPNGSGKTTLFEVLGGNLRPHAGEARLLGRKATERALVGLVGYQPEGPLPFQNLSARELLAYLGDLLGMPAALARARAEILLERLELASVRDRRIRAFSAGMARRLALAGALLSRPRVLLLDEPTAGLDPRGSLIVIEMLQELAKADGCAILMASHHLQEVEQTCARVYLLDRGSCQAEGSLDDLLGTGDRSIVVRALDDDGLEVLRRTIAQLGGEVVRIGHERRHLFALLREPAP